MQGSAFLLFITKKLSLIFIYDSGSRFLSIIVIICYRCNVLKICEIKMKKMLNFFHFIKGVKILTSNNTIKEVKVELILIKANNYALKFHPHRE